MKRIWILYRSTGSYEDARTYAIAAFITPIGAEGAKRHCDEWFKKNPRPEFDDIWDTVRGRFHPGKLRKITCPFDPGHIDDQVLEVPTYSVGELDIMTVREFYDFDMLAAARADRELEGRRVRR